MKVDIVTLRDGERDVVTYDYQPRRDDEKPMVLDVLLQAQATSMPELAFRYGCRARNCGVCTVDINGRPRIACRARVRDGDTISPMGTLPVLSDLVVRRDGISRQLRGRLAATDSGEALNREAPVTFHELTACIECYACLEGCPMHLRNFGGSKPADVSAAEQQALQQMGHVLKPLDSTYGNLQAITIAADGTVAAASDPRGVGLARVE